MSDVLDSIRLAAVQAAPVHLDREATVDKACSLILQAGKNGAKVIGFPEGFIPAHPSWYTVGPATGEVSLGLARRLFQNAVVIPSEATDRLGDACRQAGLTAVIGVCEKRPDTTGTMFNTQLFIGPDGAILGKHQKLVPTVGERLVHAGGGGDTLKAYPAPFGPVSGLVCAENANPLAVFALLNQYPLVHVAAWPAFVSRALNLEELVTSVSRGLAYTMGSFVINATGVVDQATIDAYAPSAEERAFLEKIKGHGCASIVGPTGKVLSEPLGKGEGIVYADVNLNDVLIPKLINDFAGHYNRPDVFSVRINDAAPAILSRSGTADVPSAPAPLPR